jgi:uncharacterized protein YegP (UPF0339 family)
MEDHIEIYRARRGLLSRNQFRARVVAKNGRTVWILSETYNNKGDVAGMCQRYMPQLPIKDLTV